MGIKLVIFDFDGTLCDTKHIVVTTQQQSVRKMGWPVPSSDACAATIGLKIKDCFQTLCPGMSDEDARQCIKIYRHLYVINKKIMEPGLFPNVRETLERLVAQNVLLAIASSRSSQSLAEMLCELGIARQMACVIGAEDVIYSKPNPEPVLRILELTGVPVSECLVVGDMPVDLQMGKAAETRTCAVSYGNASRQQLENETPDYIVDDIQELLMIINTRC